VRATFVLVVALRVGAGCASHGEYPLAWPPLARGAGACGGLSGEYQDYGEAGHGGAASLAQLLFGDSVTMSVGSVWLSFRETGWVDAGMRGSAHGATVDRRSAVSCRKGIATIAAGANWTGDASPMGFGIGRASHSLELRQAVGWLVVRRKTSVTGVIVAVPWHSTSEAWYRFRRLTPDLPSDGSS
jgi:hypothetical protein